MTIYTVKVDSHGNKSWYLNDKLHRTDGPAYEGADGTKYWLLDGKLHRIDGPAVEYAIGTKEWWLDDTMLTESQWKKAVKLKPSCVARLWKWME